MVGALPTQLPRARRFEAARIAAKLEGHGFNLVDDIDEQYQCVCYPIDRARSLVNVNNVYADSEYGTQKICSYVTHCGLDYVIKKWKSPEAVTEFLTEEAEGRADWKNYEIEGDDHTKHKTTLVALERTSKAVTKKGEKRKEKRPTTVGHSQRYPVRRRSMKMKTKMAKTTSSWSRG